MNGFYSREQAESKIESNRTRLKDRKTKVGTETSHQRGSKKENLI